MSISQETLEAIREYAIHNDWNVAFGGKSKGNQHLHRVNKIVDHLGKEEQARMDICVAGGWLHDLGLIKGNKHHCFTGAELARTYLADLGVDSEDVQQVAHCIEAHDGEIGARTVEAKVVHDADTIDKMGPFGFIRHVWKISLVEDLDAEQLLDKVASHIAERKSRLYLEASGEVVENLHRTLEAFLEDREIAKKVTETVAECASKGIPSEDTAQILLGGSVLEEDFRDAINCQMATCYLD